MKKALIILAFLPLISWGQFKPWLKYNGNLMKYKSSISQNSLLDGLIMNFNMYEIDTSTLVYNSSTNTVLSFGGDTVILNGSNKTEIGALIRFGNEISGDVYMILDTLGSIDSLKLDKTYTNNIGAVMYRGELSSYTENSSNNYVISQSGNSSMPYLIWAETSNAELKFDGINDYLIVDDNGELSPIGDFTWQIVYRPENLVLFQNNRILSSNYTGTEGYEIFDDRFQFRVRGSSVETKSLTDGEQFTDNIIYNLIITKNNNTYKLHVNGEGDTAFNYTVSQVATINDLHIGATRLPSSYASMGVKSIRMWDRVLNQTEINKLSSKSCFSLQSSLSLPDTIRLLTNENYTIYDNSVAAIHMDDKCTDITYTCDIGSDVVGGYNFNEIEVDTGYYNLTVTATRSGLKVDEFKTIVELFKPGISSTIVDYLQVGNSLTFLGPISDTIKAQVTGGDINLFGTLGSGNHIHEGNPGYKIIDYTTDSRILIGDRNPFWDGTKFNYSKYRSDSISSPTPMDIVAIQMGVNSSVSDVFTIDYIENTWLPNMKIFVDSVIADGTGDIIVMMTPKCTDSAELWFQERGTDEDQNFYMEKIQYIWKRVNETFGGKRYAPNVWVSSGGVFIDRKNYDDTVHPDNLGTNQITTPLRAVIERIMK
jgi:hypothetical protein